MVKQMVKKMAKLIPIWFFILYNPRTSAWIIDTFTMSLFSSFLSCDNVRICMNICLKKRIRVKLGKLFSFIELLYVYIRHIVFVHLGRYENNACILSLFVLHCVPETSYLIVTCKFWHILTKPLILRITLIERSYITWIKNAFQPIVGLSNAAFQLNGL